MDGLERRLAVARGDEPADLVVRGGKVLSVFTREWLDADVAVVDGVIAGIGSYGGGASLDASGSYVVPGFIDAHLHLETPKLMVDEFARLVHKTVRGQNILEVRYDAVAACDDFRARLQKLDRLRHRPSSMPSHQLVFFLYHFETAQSNVMDFFHSGNNRGQL